MQGSVAVFVSLAAGVGVFASEVRAKSRSPGCTWRFMGSYMWGYESPNMDYKYSYPTYDPSYNLVVE